MNLICKTAGFVEIITKAEFLTAIILGILGTALIFLAKRITKTIRNTNFISADDKVYILFKLIGVCFVLIAFVMMIIGSTNL